MCPQVTKTYTMEDLIVGCDRLPGHLVHMNNKGSCKIRKAQKEYKCFITGKPIHIGDEYRYLHVWDTHSGKHYEFHLSMDVKCNIREKLYCYPQLADRLINIKKRGFFNA